MKKIALLTLTMTLGVGASWAADSEPPQITPVSWVLATRHNGDVDDKYVTLVGHVVKQDGGSDWWFTDETGSVRLDTGDLYLPVGPKLVVSGHIDHSHLGIGYLEIEVKHWSYAEKGK